VSQINLKDVLKLVEKEFVNSREKYNS